MTNALPEHNRTTLVKYATRLYDVAARAHRKHSFDNFGVALMIAADALRQAKSLSNGAGPQHKYYVVRLLNGGAEALTKALATQGQPAFTFLVTK